MPRRTLPQLELFAASPAPPPKRRTVPAPVRREKEQLACGHFDLDSGAGRCSTCRYAADRVAAAALERELADGQLKVPAVLTIAEVSTGKVHRYAIPNQRRRRGR